MATCVWWWAQTEPSRCCCCLGDHGEEQLMAWSCRRLPHDGPFPDCRWLDIRHRRGRWCWLGDARCRPRCCRTPRSPHRRSWARHDITISGHGHGVVDPTHARRCVRSWPRALRTPWVQPAVIAGASGGFFLTIGGGAATAPRRLGDIDPRGTVRDLHRAGSGTGVRRTLRHAHRRSAPHSAVDWAEARALPSSHCL